MTEEISSHITPSIYVSITMFIVFLCPYKNNHRLWLTMISPLISHFKEKLQRVVPSRHLKGHYITLLHSKPLADPSKTSYLLRVSGARPVAIS